MRFGSKWVLQGLVCLMVVNSVGCYSTVWRSRFYLPPVAKVEQEASFAKCHTADGHVVVLSDWDIDGDKSLIRGTGIHYDESRSVVRRGWLEIPYRQILVLEASQPEEFFNGQKGIAMGVLSGLTILVALLLLG